MTDDRLFWTRLYLQSVNACATAIAAGEVQFHLLSEVLAHDLAAFSLLIATVSNIFLVGLALQKGPTNGRTPPPPSLQHPSDGQG